MALIGMIFFSLSSSAPQVPIESTQIVLLVRTDLSEVPADGKEMTQGDFIGSDVGIAPSPAPSVRQSEGRLTASSSMNSLRSRASPRKKGPWSAFVDGAKKLIDVMVDMVDSDEDEELSQKASHSRHASSLSAISDTELSGFHTEDRQNSKISLGDVTEPMPLRGNLGEGKVNVSIREPSQLMARDDMNCLASHMPLRHREKAWTLLYSTHRDGISMQTMLRKSRNMSPTVLVVRDMEKHVFGAFCSEPWKISSRYYGTGETFVFTISPQSRVWHWWWQKSREVQNDFFMWGTPEAIAVGGAGGYALWLDAELCQGISRSSLTFGNQSLSSSEEFMIGAVELWGLD